MDLKSQLGEAFVKYVAPVLITAAASGLVYLLTFAGRWLQSKAANSRLAGFAAKLDSFALVIVNDLEATVKPQLVADLATGQITNEQGAQLKALAIARIKVLLAERGIAELGSLLGVAGAAVDTYLSGVVEHAVAKLPVTSASPS